VRSETLKYLAKAERCLANATICLSVNLTNDAGRGAYLAAFHAAQALIFERTGKASKTHNGVHTQFDRLVMSEPELEKLPTFLHQAYNLKAVADYETDADSDITLNARSGLLMMHAVLLWPFARR
jgi:uncharacterized protein (UPF0332 family)